MELVKIQTLPWPIFFTGFNIAVAFQCQSGIKIDESQVYEIFFFHVSPSVVQLRTSYLRCVTASRTATITMTSLTTLFSTVSGTCRTRTPRLATIAPGLV